MNKKVSIIVPIYNVSKYLEQNIESIINQTYKNIEIILVNDGSTDNSLDICNKYKKIDSRIIVINKKNGGIANARNAGLDICTGDYICFVDSDDYLDINYVEVLLNRVIKDKTLVAQCCIKEVDDDGNILNEYGYKDKKFISGRELNIDSFQDYLIPNVVVWDRIYDKKIFKSLRFPDGKSSDDEYISFVSLYDIKKISLVPDKLYYYRYNPNSYTKTKITYQKLTLLELLKRKIELCESKNDQELYKKSLIQFLDTSIGLYSRVYKEIDKKDSHLNDIYKDYLKYLKLVNNISLKKRFKYIVFKYFPAMYVLIRGK